MILHFKWNINMSVGARGAFKSQAQMKSAFMLLFRISSVAACYISTNSEKKTYKKCFKWCDKNVFRLLSRWNIIWCQCHTTDTSVCVHAHTNRTWFITLLDEDIAEFMFSNNEEFRVFFLPFVDFMSIKNWRSFIEIPPKCFLFWFLYLS